MRPNAFATCQGWAAFELQGEVADVRPVYLSKLPGPHYTVAWPELGKGGRASAGAKAADWILGAGTYVRAMAVSAAERARERRRAVQEPDRGHGLGTG